MINFSKPKNGMKLEKIKIYQNCAVSSAYGLKKLVCKIWDELNDKNGVKTAFFIN